MRIDLDTRRQVALSPSSRPEPQWRPASSQSAAPQPARVTVLSPRGGETVIVGQHVLISWNTSCCAGLVFHQVQLSTNGGATYTRNISPLLDGKEQHYLWLPTADAVTPAARVRVMAINWGEAVSDRPFLIQSPSG